jgi:hypothetical protein
MKTPKLLEKVEKILHAKEAKQRQHAKCFKEILHKLKKRQKDLKEKLKDTSNEKERKRIKRDLAIIHTQRKKGIQALKDLKKNS